MQGYGVADANAGFPRGPNGLHDRIASASSSSRRASSTARRRTANFVIDEQVSKYASQARHRRWASITIRQLLTHTSGLDRERATSFSFKTQSDTDIIAAAASRIQSGAPQRGEQWEYSNLGYYALAEIIRVASGRPWNDSLNERVFKPAGMTATLPTNTTQSVANRAKGYSGKDNTRAALEWTALRPSGAFLSTVFDLAKWEALLLTDRILTESTRRPCRRVGERRRDACTVRAATCDSGIAGYLDMADRNLPRSPNRVDPR